MSGARQNSPSARNKYGRRLGPSHSPDLSPARTVRAASERALQTNDAATTTTTSNAPASPSPLDHHNNNNSSESASNACVERGHLLQDNRFVGKCFLCSGWGIQALRCSRCRAQCHRHCAEEGADDAADDNDEPLESASGSINHSPLLLIPPGATGAAGVDGADHHHADHGDGHHHHGVDDERVLQLSGSELGRVVFEWITDGNLDAIQRLSATQLRYLSTQRFGDDQYTPLIKCITTYGAQPRDNVVRVFAYLLERTDDDVLNLTDGRAQYTPLHWAFVNSYASPRLLDMLLARPKIDVTRALTVLCGVYHRADYKKYFELMVKNYRADVNEQGSHKNTPLHKACQNQSIGAVLVRALLQHDADIERVNDLLQTPLFEAVVRDQEEIVTALLTAGASVSAIDIKQKSPAHYAQSAVVRQLLADAQERVNKLEEWLRSLKLEMHLQKFVNHKIYLDVAPGLTDENLERIGIKKVGDRILLLNGVKDLVRRPVSVDQPPAELAAAEPSSHHKSRGSGGKAKSKKSKSSTKLETGGTRRNSGTSRSASKPLVPVIAAAAAAAAAAATSATTASLPSSVSASSVLSSANSATPSPTTALSKSTSIASTTRTATSASNAATTGDDDSSTDSDLDYGEHPMRNAAAPAAAPAAVARPLIDQGLIEYRKIKFYEELGRGTFGTVYRGAIDGKQVAIKIIEPRQPEMHAHCVKQLCKQYELWSTLNDKHIARLIGICLQPQLALITEVCKRGNLLSVMRQSGLNVHWQMALTWSMQIAAAVFYLISNDPPIFHRDLKPANVLVSQKWRLKLCDFDTARYAAHESAVSVSAGGQLVGSPAYIAPELFTELEYTEKCDIYSMAVTLNELFGRCISGEHSAPYSDRQLPGVPYAALILAAQKKARPVIHAQSPPALAALITRAWAQSPAERPTCEELIEQLAQLAQQYMSEREQWDAIRDQTKINK